MKTLIFIVLMCLGSVVNAADSFPQPFYRAQKTPSGYNYYGRNGQYLGRSHQFQGRTQYYQYGGKHLGTEYRMGNNSSVFSKGRK